MAGAPSVDATSLVEAMDMYNQDNNTFPKIGLIESRVNKYSQLDYTHLDYNFLGRNIAVGRNASNLYVGFTSYPLHSFQTLPKPDLEKSHHDPSADETDLALIGVHVRLLVF